MKEKDIDNLLNIDGEEYLSSIEKIKLPGIKYNLLKALFRIVYGIVEIPNAYLERFSSNIRNKTNQQISLKNFSLESGIQFLKTDENFIYRNKSYFENEISNSQKNRENIFKKVFNYIKDNKNSNSTETEIDTDWLTKYSKLAEQVSKNEIQEVLAKVLADEINSPGMFNFQTLHILSFLDSKRAKLFQKFCNMSFKFYVKNTKYSGLILEHLTDHSNGLRKYGLSYTDLQQLMDIGLIQSNFQNRMVLTFTKIEESKEDFSNIIKITVGNNKYEYDLSKLQDELKVSLIVINFTLAGEQISSLYEAISNKEYEEGLIELLNKKLAVKNKVQ